MDFYTSIEQRGNSFYVRGIENGRRVQFRTSDFSPFLCVKTNKPTQLRSPAGEPLERVKFTDIREAKDFVKQYSDVDGFNIYGTQVWNLQYINRNWKGDISFNANQIKVFNMDIEVYSAEGFPEPADAAYPVTSIALRDSSSGKLYVWSMGDYENSRDDVEYHKCGTESELLSMFLSFWSIDHPDVITGWNTETFDIPYLVRRIEKILGESAIKRLSPWGFVYPRSGYDNFGNEITTYTIVGVASLDYLDLFKKYTYTNQESYSLDHIAYVVLKERKLDYSEAGSLHQLYMTDFQKFIDYNIKDVELVHRIDEKMKLLELVYTLAYMTKQNYEDTFSPVKSWEAMIYNYYQDQGMYDNVKSVHGNSKQKILGAFVKEVRPRMYKWVLSFDLNSLYPHLIMQYNLGLDTIVRLNNPLESLIGKSGTDHRETMRNISDRVAQKISATRHIKGAVIDINDLVHAKHDLSFLEDLNMTMAANGVFYRKDNLSVFSFLMKKLYDDRKIAKKIMLGKEQEREDNKNEKDIVYRLTQQIAALENKQMALKILLNSGYGAMANAYFQYFDLGLAESVTLSGQLSIRWIERKLNEYLNKILGTSGQDYAFYCDTDSVYLEFDKLVEYVFGTDIPEEDNVKVVNYLDKIAKEKIEPFIEKCYEELAEYVNAYQNAMVMKREVISTRGFWTAKKRYALMVYDSEGVRYAEPNVKTKGLENVKSSTPEYFRKKLDKSFKLILTSDNQHILDFIEETRAEFKTLSVSDLALPSGMNGLEKYSDGIGGFISGTPKHVKAAIAFNNMLAKTSGLNIQPLKNGDKIKVVDLKVPNPTGMECIGFPSSSSLPPEFNLSSYVDYDTMFNKAYFGPLRNVLGIVGWRHEDTVSLEDFFS